MQMRKYMRGVTLLELMIVVVIIGVMMAIAFPNYREFTARAKRNEAKAMLLEIATAQERFYLQNSTYGTLVELGYPDPLPSDTGSYNVTVIGPDSSNYLAQAVYTKSDAESGKCPTFTIDGRGDKTSPDGSYSDCWTRTR